MTCPENTTIGAYVLGALDAAERRTTEQHLETCATCRETLLQFAHLPGLLHAVPLEDLESTEPQLPALRLRKRPARRRWVLAAVAAVVMLIGGVVSWQTLDNPASVTWSATNGVGGIDTKAELTGHGWGTDIQLRMADMKAGEHCELIVHGRDGTVETAGWWAAPASYKADVPASTSIPLADIDRLEVVTSGGQLLSTVTGATR